LEWIEHSKNGSGKELSKYLRVNWREVEAEYRLRWLEDVEKNLQEIKNRDGGRRPHSQV